MKLHRNGTNWNREERNKTNENWDEIEGNYNNVVENVSDKAFDKVVDSAKLNWKEPVDTLDNLPSDAVEGDTRMVRDTGKVYRYNGTAWQEIQEIDATAINEIDSRLTLQLSETLGDIRDVWYPIKQPDINSHFIDGDYAKRHIYDEWISLFDSIYTQNDSYVNKKVLGKIYEERYDFPVYTFTPENGYSKKIILGSGMHGGEKLAIISLYKFLKHLCEDWKTNPQLAYIRNNVQLIVMPLQNPFGIAYHTRKNGNEVDINRNFNYKWNEFPSLSEAHQNYKGDTAESERETRFISSVLSENHDALAYIDFHNKSTVGLGEGFSNTAYIPSVQPFDYNLLNNLMDRLNVEGQDYEILAGDFPSGFNYATGTHRMTSFDPEYLPGHHAEPYSSEDMTKALEWYSNIVFRFSTLETKAGVGNDRDAFVSYHAANRTTATSYPIETGEYSDIKQLTRDFYPRSKGILKATHTITYSATDSSALVYFCPVIYQDGNVGEFSPSSTIRFYRDMFEVYERTMSDRATITTTAMMAVDPSDFKGFVRSQLWAYTTSGEAKILKYRLSLEFSPSEREDGFSKMIV